MADAPGAINADERAAAVPPSEVVITAGQAEAEAEAIKAEAEQEHQREKAQRKEHENALAAVQGAGQTTLSHKLQILLEKTRASARDSRGVVHEMWSYLLPRQQWWFVVDVMPGLVFSGSSLVIEGLQLAGSQPIPADVIKVLIRNGAAANLGQAAVLILAAADAYASLKHGCDFAAAVGYAMSLARFQDQQVLPRQWMYRQMWSVWIIGQPYLRVVANRALWRSWISVTPRNFWSKSAAPNTILGRVGYTLLLTGPNSAALPTADITWPRIVAWMVVLSMGGQIPAAFCGDIEQAFRTHALSAGGGITVIRFPPLIMPLAADYQWVADRLATYAAQTGSCSPAHFLAVENMATQHWDAPRLHCGGLCNGKTKPSMIS